MANKRRELFAPGYGTGFKMWIAVESLRCAEYELEGVARRYKVPLELVRRCRSVAFHALEEAFWKEDPCRLVPPPRRRSKVRDEMPAHEVRSAEHNPEQFVESLLHRVHLKSLQPLADNSTKYRGRRPGARGHVRGAGRDAYGRRSARDGSGDGK